MKASGFISLSYVIHGGWFETLWNLWYQRVKNQGPIYTFST